MYQPTERDIMNTMKRLASLAIVGALGFAAGAAVGPAPSLADSGQKCHVVSTATLVDKQHGRDITATTTKCGATFSTAFSMYLYH